MSPWTVWTPRLRSLLRIAAALTFLQSGFPIWVARSLGFEANWIASMLEVIAGGLMLLGWFTRPVAIALAVLTLVGYLGRHWPHGAESLIDGFAEIAVYFLLWLYLAAAGPGPWSLDERSGRKPEHAGRSPGSRLYI